MKRLLIISTLIFSIQGCQEHKKNWTEAIKEKIIEDTSIQPNSITTGNSRDGLLYESYYKDSVLLYEQAYSNKSERYVISILYSADQKFQVIRELCSDEIIGFEGIRYNNDFYGLSTWWYCNSQKQMEGMQFKNKKVGIWKTWEDTGQLKDSINYGNEELIDSLKTVKYYC